MRVLSDIGLARQVLHPNGGAPSRGAGLLLEERLQTRVGAGSALASAKLAELIERQQRLVRRWRL